MKTTLYSLHAQTSIHAGKGQDDSVVDLPIQREPHTGYPCVFGSSMKGALRCYAENISKKKDSNISEKNINELFGKEGDGDNGNAGALLISDARLLLLPIRSLTGQFKWVTCPAVLTRFKTDAKRFGAEVSFDIPNSIAKNSILTPKQDDMVYLQEYRFQKSDATLDETLVSTLANYVDYDNAEDMLTEQLAIIHDDDFAYLAQYTMPVNPHIKLDNATKTTVGGALWYEEVLPSDTVMYVGIAADSVRKKDSTTSAEEVLSTLTGLFEKQPWLQVGGNETVGMGWFNTKNIANASL